MKFPPKFKPFSALDIAWPWLTFGQTGYAAVALYEAANEDNPRNVYAREGDELIIRGFSE